MSQSGYTPILIYASGTATNVPLAANLTSSASGAELALNYADGKLYYKNSSGVVTLLAGATAGPAGGSNTQVQFNSSGVLAGSANLTWSGTALAVTGTLSATGVATFSAGTAALPAITTTGDTNTGIWFPAADTIAFTEGGVESMRIDSSGNLGVGTSSPGVKLETSTARSATVTSAIFGQTGTGAVNDVNKITLRVQNTLGGSTGGAGIGAVLEASASNQTGLSFYYDGGSGAQTDGMRLDSSGNLGIGTTSPNISAGSSGSQALTVSASASARNALIELKGTRTSADQVSSYIRSFSNSGATPGVDLQFYRGTTDTDGFLTISTSGSERARITSTGVLTVNYTGAGLADGNFVVAGSNGTGQGAANTVAQCNFWETTSGNAAGLWIGAKTDETTAVIGTRTATGNLAFQTYNGGWGERMRLTYDGNLCVGNTNSAPGSGNTVTGATLNGGLGIGYFSRASDSSLIINTNTNSKVSRIYRSGSEVGDITVTTTTTSFNSTSDYRLKTVLGAVSDSGSRIDALEPIEYTWNSTGLRTRGFLAHKFQEVYANSVTGTKDAIDANGNPEYQSMQASTSEVIADLVAEIQSLRKRLAAAGI